MATEYQQHQFAPTELVAGAGCVDELRRLADEHDVQDVMLVSGPTTGSTAAVMDPIREALGDRVAHEYDTVESHVPTTNVDTAIETMTDVEADLLVSIGGGSAHDTAKAISILSAEGGDPHQYKVRREDGELVAPALTEPKTPIVAVPTTLSAAELNGAAAITDAETGEKMIVTSEGAIPVAALYDSEIAIHTPTGIISATGMNAVDHTVEMVYSRHHSAFTDATALRGLSLLSEWLPKTIENPDDLEAREQVLLGSALSGFGMEKGVCINHAICHILGGKFGVPHGDANSIIIPHGMRFNLDETAARQRLMAEALGVDTEGLTDGEAGEQAIAAIESLRNTIGAPTKLRDTTVTKDDFEEIAAEAIQDLPMANTPKDVTEADIVAILEDAW